MEPPTNRVDKVTKHGDIGDASEDFLETEPIDPNRDYNTLPGGQYQIFFFVPCRAQRTSQSAQCNVFIIKLFQFLKHVLPIFTIISQVEECCVSLCVFAI